MFYNPRQRIFCLYQSLQSAPERGRIILDVRGNGGGEDKPIDHIAKRLYGNQLNTYKRCECHDSPISDFILHHHGAYKPSNYQRDGLTADNLIQRSHFSEKNQPLFDETDVFYPFHTQKGYRGRVDILLDSAVGSSAESAYTSFYHHPNVRYIGENTAGMQQYTQGSLTMPCGYLMRVGATKLTYWDKEGENIEIRGHKPDLSCSGRDALDVALSLPRDEGRVLGQRQTNEPRSEREVYLPYDPKADGDIRKAYYAKYLEEGLRQIETKNIIAERLAHTRHRLAERSSDQTPTNTPQQQVQTQPTSFNFFSKQSCSEINR